MDSSLRSEWQCCVISSCYCCGFVISTVIVGRNLKALKKDFSQDRALRNDNRWILCYTQNDSAVWTIPQLLIKGGVFFPSLKKEEEISKAKREIFIKRKITVSSYFSPYDLLVRLIVVFKLTNLSRKRFLIFLQTKI